jgi:hypothetical protein
VKTLRNIPELERAFQLAKSGTYATVVDIRKRLQSEGYSGEQMTGALLSKQLRAIMKECRPEPPDGSGLTQY